uniref:Putative translational regulator n=1 Tax=viral metagenome TaxID=1070528 RepID=A0A6M3K9X8_9ZZZZ
MQEIRCKKCNRLLMKGSLVCAEIKCPKCGYLNKFLENAIEGTLKKGEFGNLTQVRIITK